MQINRVQYSPKFGNLMIQSRALDQKSFEQLYDIQKIGKTLDGTDAHLVLESDGSRSIITPTGEKLKSDSITVTKPYVGWGFFNISGSYKDAKGAEHTYEQSLNFPTAIHASQAYNLITHESGINSDVEIVKLLDKQKDPSDDDYRNLKKNIYKTYQPYNI